MSINVEDNEEYEEYEGQLLGTLVEKCPELCAKFQAQLDALSEEERERLQDEVLALAEIVDERQQAFFADLKRSAVQFIISNSAGTTVTVNGCNFTEQ
jgi:hypothetical protein